MPYHSSDEEMNITASSSATTRTRSTRRDRRPAGGRIRRRRGDDSDSSEEDDEEVDLDSLKKKSTLSENASSDLTNDGDTEMVDRNDKNDNDNFKSKEQNEHQMFPSQQQDDSSQTQTQTQTLDQSQETSPHGLAIGDADLDTLRILLSTDNHLGYAEDDNVRGNDSFSALEEVLFLAKEYRCDMVLLAGDLFHHNRPSRRTLYKTSKNFYYLS